jgi:uncharacterized membrane protein YdfJ with MMPL/SSD domain
MSKTVNYIVQITIFILFIAISAIALNILNLNTLGTVENLIIGVLFIIPLFIIIKPLLKRFLNSTRKSSLLNPQNSND